MEAPSLQWMLIDGFSCAICLYVFKEKWLTSSKPPYPPGPTDQSWFTGNLSDFPVEAIWLKFTEWADEFGDIVHLRVLDKHSIIVNSLDVAKELFEKRSNIYSSRPPSAMVDLMGGEFITPLKTYGDDWRLERRMFQQFFKPDVLQQYQDVQTRKINDLLSKLLVTPDDFLDHIRYSIGAVIMSIMYDHEVASQDDRFIKVAETANQKFAIGSTPSVFLVNVFPILRFVPAWFPGAGFKLFAREASLLAQQMLNDPIDMVRERMKSGEGLPCVASELLEMYHTERDLKNVLSMCGSGYSAGTDTSVSVIQTFFYAMIRFGDVQVKAHEEIDKVLGGDRLPKFEDRAALPYIEALLRELLRWHPILPVGIMHYTTEEDIFQGYFIPKGTTFFPNVWAMSREPNKYEDPNTFNPSRFLDNNGSLNDDDVGYAFGFGRRICPGCYFASATVWLAVVSILASFEIRKKKDASGQELPVDVHFSTDSILSHPSHFNARLYLVQRALKTSS
ncbi:cytochrome P450 [Crepidotus variabilis]|uniref:Cytochrome P450 n=1 Tax=Crepidotus variabilis TaxID=179855 RepID=A0A9P6EF42_9AGAR|nr:cytochrome P450 [Crepidotus variabilis]